MTESLQKENERIISLLPEMAKIYGVTGEVRDLILKSTVVEDDAKDYIISHPGQRFEIFEYEVEGIRIKSALSFTESNKKNPLLFFVRGGHMDFAIPSPTMKYHALGTKHVSVMSLERGGLSEGIPDAGGSTDSGDLYRLFQLLPKLEAKYGFTIDRSRIYLVGASFGGMQSSALLERYPEVQQAICGWAIVAGMMHFQKTLNVRPDLAVGLGSVYPISQKWVAEREPIRFLKCIRRDLPILVIHGTQDERVPIEAIYIFLDELQELGFEKVEFREMEANHQFNGGYFDIARQVHRWMGLYD